MARSHHGSARPFDQQRLGEALRRWRDAGRHDPATRAAILRRVEGIARLMDTAVVIPVIGRRVGLDALLGLVPVIGDGVGAAVATWVVVESWRLGAPPRILGRMLANIAVDAGLGAVPVAGDVFDAAWQANRRNVDLLRDWLDGRG